MAARTCASPSGTIRAKHSARTDPTNRSAKAFKFGLRAGRRTSVTQEVPEGGCVERVSVENQVVRVAEEAIVRVGQVPCHLCHPRFVRVTRDTGDLHGAG